MDDDLAFGTAVWGSTEPVSLFPPKQDSAFLPSPSTSAPPSQSEDDFDDFDDFGSAAEVSQDVVDDDDFGDFGDADEIATPADFGSQIPVAGPSRGDWEALSLNPFPGREELTEQINDILDPVWSSIPVSNYLTQDGIRDVEGVNQILMTNESRELYSMLVQSPPPTKPPNWIRSRIRRQHLIALGIPVNLDEVLPAANGKALPPLQITTRPMSAPPGPRNARNSASTPASEANSRAGSPRNSTAARSSQFGPKPRLDGAKIGELLELDIDNLKLQPLPVLERHLNDMKMQTANVSALLTHLLQTRDALQQDSETYNGLIAELIGEAQKNKTGKGRTVTKRGSGMV